MNVSASLEKYSFQADVVWHQILQQRQWTAQWLSCLPRDSDEWWAGTFFIHRGILRAGSVTSKPIDLHKELQFGPRATEISPFSPCITHLPEGLLLSDLLLFLESILLQSLRRARTFHHAVKKAGHRFLLSSPQAKQIENGEEQYLC